MRDYNQRNNPYFIYVYTYQEQQKLFLCTYTTQQDQRTDTWIDIMNHTDWSKSRQLTISKCQMNDQTIDEFLNKKWPSLASLYIDNKMSTKMIKKLTQKNWPLLEILSLRSCEIQDDGLQILFHNLHNFAPKINNLDITGCGLTVRGMKIFTQERLNLTNLNCLYLDENRIGTQGIKYLIKSNLPNLDSLIMQKCQIRDEGFKYLTKGLWKNLTILMLGKYSENDNFDGRNYVLLNGWQKYYENTHTKIRRFQVLYRQPICCINSVLIEGLFSIRTFQIQVCNKRMSDIIKMVFANRRFNSI